MSKTGHNEIEILADAAPNRRAEARLALAMTQKTSVRFRGSLLTITLAVFLAAPVSFEASHTQSFFKVAHAGAGEGNFGNGKGNGGPNGQNPGNGGGNGGGNEGNENNGGGSSEEGETGAPPSEIVGETGGDSDEASALADDEFSETIDAVGTSEIDDPFSSGVAAGLPTISQLFSLGDKATVSQEDELRLISNGWTDN